MTSNFLALSCLFCFLYFDEGIPFSEPLCEHLYVLNECFQRISLEEDVINVMSYLWSSRKLDAVKILPAKIVCDIKVVEVSHEPLGKGILFPFGGKASERMLK